MRLELEACEFCGAAVMGHKIKKHWDWHIARGHDFPSTITRIDYEDLKKYGPLFDPNDREWNCWDCVTNKAVWEKGERNYCDECVAEGDMTY